MSVRRIFSLSLIGFCWMYFTHVLPLSASLMANSITYYSHQASMPVEGSAPSSLGSCDKEIQQVSQLEWQSSRHNSVADDVLVVKRLRKRRHSDLQDHLKKQPAQVVSKVLLSPVNVPSEDESGPKYPVRLFNFASAEITPLLPPPKV
jgi:hypothetical protein